MMPRDCKLPIARRCSEAHDDRGAYNQRQNAMRHGFALELIVATAVGTAASTPSLRQSGPLSIQDAVARYASGDFATAVRDLDTRALKVAPFTRALNAWIAAGDPAFAPRRRR